MTDNIKNSEHRADVVDQEAAIKVLRKKLADCRTAEYAAINATTLAHRALLEAIDRLTELTKGRTATLSEIVDVEEGR